MNYTDQETESGRTVWIKGRLTISDRDHMRALLAEVSAVGGQDIVFDLSELEFIDSSGLGMLIIAQSEVSKVKGALHIRNPLGQVAKVLETTHISTLIPIINEPTSKAS